MKALSIRQPWAWLIAHGFKDIENRDWTTRYRGPFLVHASQAFNADGYEWVQETFPGIAMPAKADFERGGIVGQTEIVDCVEESGSPWFFGTYGFVLQNAKPLPYRPMAGKLNFFNVDVS